MIFLRFWRHFADLFDVTLRHNFACQDHVISDMSLVLFISPDCFTQSISHTHATVLGVKQVSDYHLK